MFLYIADMLSFLRLFSGHRKCFYMLVSYVYFFFLIQKITVISFFWTHDQPIALGLFATQCSGERVFGIFTLRCLPIISRSNKIVL